MSYALVKPLALVATGLIAASAVEKGFRLGPVKANTELASFDAQVLMNTTRTTSNDYYIDQAGSKIRNFFHFDTGVMSSVTKGAYAVKGVFSALSDNIVPLAIAVGSFFTGGIIGAVGVGFLGLWGATNAVRSSGLMNDKGSSFLDIRM